MRDIIINYYYGDEKKHHHHKHHHEEYGLALQGIFSNFKITFMAISFELSQFFDGNIVVVNKTTGAPVDPQPTLSAVSVSSADPSTVTVTFDPNAPTKVRLDGLKEGSAQINLSVQADFGGGDVRTFSGAVSAVVGAELIVTITGAAVNK